MLIRDIVKKQKDLPNPCAVVVLDNNTTLYFESWGGKYEAFFVPGSFSDPHDALGAGDRTELLDCVDEFEAQMLLDHYLAEYGDAAA